MLKYNLTLSILKKRYLCMKRKLFKLFVLFIFAFISCDKEEKNTEEPIKQTFIFKDGFETENNQINELFTIDGERWTTIQQTNPTNATNKITISSSTFTEGKNAIRFLSNKSDSQLSKIDIEKNGLQIVEGDKVTITANFYIVGTDSIENLLLIDLECCSCWDPTVGDNYGAENQCPGIRLMMSGGNDYLSIERGKISGTTIQQTNFAFPRDQWVTVEWEMVMSTTNTGTNKLRINQTQVINQPGMNMPNAQVFKDAFIEEGINFSLQEPVSYERVQIGATANPTANNVELFVDDFSIKIE